MSLWLLLGIVLALHHAQSQNLKTTSGWRATADLRWYDSLWNFYLLLASINYIRTVTILHYIHDTADYVTFWARFNSARHFVLVSSRHLIPKSWQVTQIIVSWKENSFRTIGGIILRCSLFCCHSHSINSINCQIVCCCCHTRLNCMSAIIF